MASLLRNITDALSSLQLVGGWWVDHGYVCMYIVHTEYWAFLTLQYSMYLESLKV